MVLTVLAWPAPAAAQEESGGEELSFDYGVDGVSWYWSRQIDETLELGSISQQVEWPNPQSATTMPVAVELGENTKVAALSFNLAERGVTEGSEITDFKLTVAEGDDAGDSPTFNPTGKLVQACPITEAWTTGEAEMWDVQPPVGDGCVVGERAEPDPQEVADAEALLAAAQEAVEGGGEEVPVVEVPLPTWTFDLTELAKDWGQDPFANYGVMFMPVMDEATPVDTWQVNLKLPLRDDTQTPVNEYDATAYRLAATFSYTPGEAPEDGASDPGGDVIGGGSGGSGGGSGGGGGGTGGGTDEPAPEESASAEELAPAAYEPLEPKAPWYVWTLIPAGIVGAYLLHSVLGASSAAAGGGGAIDRIRAHNLDKRGWALPVPAGLWQKLTGRGGRS
ncbi:hypothetical protein O1R50_04610 [Glycomyces luteolus]|uniref:Uncharacterized protein n=1 Tax=Glycomyces luteolus TaxID=2670330 RepID=A0A9X3P782_9ACTN|nr:hypothetical protein [Glycomyces luteolus]MDA1358891.1 hypothetical protein [Glycomyces luteolus]